MFYILDENDFYRRLLYRFNGEYKRYDVAEKEARAEKKQTKPYNSHSNRIVQVCQDIDRGRNYWKKFLLFINRRVRDHLFK